ncbi:MAG: hypothetical protein D4R64_18805 [Porphyromonadaceae bacterium]|nr:MAG: hypothetical protein D4R64_18805 [Porphyromonadaceae bacterium]
MKPIGNLTSIRANFRNGRRIEPDRSRVTISAPGYLVKQVFRSALSLVINKSIGLNVSISIRTVSNLTPLRNA